MAHGYNSDVVFDGTVYHVQSEKRGTEAAVLETLVYCGGRIVHHERFAAPGDPDEAERRLDAQHRDVVRRTRHGAFPAGDRTGPEPEPADLAAELAAAVTEGALGLSFDGRASGDLTGRLRALRADGSPAKGARLSARVVGPGLSPANVWLGKAGTDGAAKVAAALPAAAALAVVFRAELDESSGRLRIERGTGGSAAGAEAVASADAEEPSPTMDPDEQEMTKLQPASVSD